MRVMGWSMGGFAAQTLALQHPDRVWHSSGVANRLRRIPPPVLIATGTEDIVIPGSNALKLVNAIPGAWLAQFPSLGPCVHGPVSTSTRRPNQQFSRTCGICLTNAVSTGLWPVHFSTTFATGHSALATLEPRQRQVRA
jgi:hypothetical protein